MSSENLTEFNLSFTLATLKEWRSSLVRGFLEIDVEIYEPCFDFENDNDADLLELSIDKYFLIQLDCYWIIVESLLLSKTDDPNLQEVLKKKCLNIFLRLSKNTLQLKGDKSIMSQDLIKLKINILVSMEIDQKLHKQNINKLKYAHRRNRVLYKRTREQTKKAKP